jgi:hypothetical protein
MNTNVLIAAGLGKYENILASCFTGPADILRRSAFCRILAGGSKRTGLIVRILPAGKNCLAG